MIPIVGATPAQSFWDHLSELRFRLVRMAWAILLAGGCAFYFSEQIFNIVRHPIAEYLPTGGLVFTSPVDKFMAHVKLSMMTGIVVSCPFWLYQLWMFIAPGLYSKEKKYTFAFILSGMILFATGVLFVYYVVLPAAFEFLLNFGGSVDKPMITIGEYMSFFLTTTLLFGLAFELPLVIVILGAMGVVSPEFLRNNRRYAIVGISVLSAVVTPPDLFSMLALLLPLVLLYEASIWIVALIARNKRIAAKT